MATSPLPGSVTPGWLISPPRVGSPDSPDSLVDPSVKLKHGGGMGPSLSDPKSSTEGGGAALIGGGVTLFEWVSSGVHPGGTSISSSSGSYPELDAAEDAPNDGVRSICPSPKLLDSPALLTKLKVSNCRHCSNSGNGFPSLRDDELDEDSAEALCWASRILSLLITPGSEELAAPHLCQIPPDELLSGFVSNSLCVLGSLILDDFLGPGFVTVFL